MKGSGGSADLRAAVIGYGLAGETLHTPLISAVPGIEVAAIVTRDEACCLLYTSPSPRDS